MQHTPGQPTELRSCVKNQQDTKKEEEKDEVDKKKEEMGKENKKKKKKRSCVKVEVAVRGSGMPSPKVLTVSVDVKQY